MTAFFQSLHKTLAAGFGLVVVLMYMPIFELAGAIE